MKPLKYVAPVIMFATKSPKWYQNVIVHFNLIANSILPTRFLKWVDGRKRLEKKRKKLKAQAVS